MYTLRRDQYRHGKKTILLYFVVSEKDLPSFFHSLTLARYGHPTPLNRLCVICKIYVHDNNRKFLNHVQYGGQEVDYPFPT